MNYDVMLLVVPLIVDGLAGVQETIVMEKVIVVLKVDMFIIKKRYCLYLFLF